MEGEQVRMWRARELDRVLLMAGRTTNYAVEPRGEYVFGIVLGAPMRSRRGSEQRLVEPGQLVAWDPSAAHRGAAVGSRAWHARLMVVETADLATLAGDQEVDLPADVVFPDPTVSDPDLARSFLRMHRSFESPSSTRLEVEQRLAEWFDALLLRTAGGRPVRQPLNARDAKALRRACEFLADQPERNVGLDELATVAGIGKFRLIRLFGERFGLPPHGMQIAHRVRKARRLLEAGEPVAAVATATGFADQGHLHRHFRRSLGMTPGQYRRRFVRS